MRVFIDANILVSVLNKEYPSFTVTSRVLSLSGHQNFDLFTSPIALAIAFYFAEKKSGTSVAKSKIELLINHIWLTTCCEADARNTIANKKINDFEDGLQYYSALSSKCDCIVTQDLGDYYFSDIEVLAPLPFMQKYLV